ncbi:DUF4350 domain-containing protein [Psychrobacter sp. I-STPA10]|uniref:DUF4350 domain-containing protein n=1 Tax=Psychrobacter sp. I-STPA10 TaxID=2585769 RepID=UPI001E59D9DC|nr:DUF4350 domain-containing protein [Psychrobacter sp. I-STPA10]
MKATKKWKSQSLPRNIRSMSPIKLLLLFLLLAALVWTGVWFWQNLERVEKIDYEPNSRINYNPYYAAELLINSHNTGDDYGGAYTDLDSDLKLLIDNLPSIDPQSPQHPTLLINSIGGTLTPERFQKLRSWIEQGGHVITFTQAEISQQNLEELLARLQTLKQQATNGDNQSINTDEVQKKFLELVDNDAQINEKLSEFGGNNQLLLRLGIFAVNQSEADADSLEESIKQSIESAAKEQIESENKKGDADNIDDLLDELAVTFQSITPLSVDDGNSIIMVQTDSSYNHLNHQMFKQLYSTEKSLYHGVTDKKLAEQIRQYLRQQLVILQKTYDVDVKVNLTASSSKDGINNKDIDNTNDKPTADATDESSGLDSELNNELAERILLEMLKERDSKEDAAYLAKLITIAINLDDKKLLQLFTPAKDIFFDSTFGKGRISVVINNQSFTNPDPNLDLIKHDSNTNANTTARSSNHNSSNSNPLEVPLLNTLDWFGLRINLSSMDNASWLLTLTQNSSQVVILPNTDIDALPVMLWKHARLAILGLLLLVLVWLWSLYDRFGKTQYLTDSQAHDILRYFQQVGYYGWKYDHAVKLAAATQQQIQQLLQQHLPQLTNSKSATSKTASIQSNGSAINHTMNTANIDEMIVNLQQLLSKQLQDKFQINGNVIQDKETLNDNTAITTTTATNDWLDKAMQHNKARAQEAISISRLQTAIAPLLSNLLSERLPSSNQTQMNASQQIPAASSVTEFTELTQTLWVVQWLLK